MRVLASSLRDYRESAAAFSRPARWFLLATFLSWVGHGVHSVLFNLYLRDLGFREAFIGSAVSWGGIGLALAALPGGLLADRWGRRRTLLLGGAFDGIGLLSRSLATTPEAILAASFVAGVGQSLLAVAAAPFLTEHSAARERTLLFSSFFAIELLAGVAGSLLGGWLPGLADVLPEMLHPAPLAASRLTLVAGGMIGLASLIPLLALRGAREAPIVHVDQPGQRRAIGQLLPIGVNAFLIGAGAGLVIPFMNLYFAQRFDCSSGQIGVFFSVAQISTAIAALAGPAIARRFGKLRTATAAELLSLPFLVSLGAENHLGVAVAAFWLRATLMQASIPLASAFVMEVLPASLRARATSLMNLVWNIGWAASATLSGAVIQRFGYAVPFYATAVLYAIAATYFYLSFRRYPETGGDVKWPDEAKGVRGPGPVSE
ncbi:MAG TPA: MFS transporter [Candidatus Limnocylindria bacterium]|nr:MFS transporter [Candidatus Limnocylindria bacterium]